MDKIDKEFYIACYTYMAIITVFLFCVFTIANWIIKLVR